MPDKWCKTPKHLLREKALRFIIKKREPARFLELGAGTGETTKIFLNRGFTGICYDLSPENRHILSDNLTEFHCVRVVDEINTLEWESFDYLFAFEVLEHIENDLETLKKWSLFLKSGGTAVVSVPAHMKKFGKSDEAVGHVRRYEKDELVELLQAAGYTNLQIYNYGFPLGNLSRKLSNLLCSYAGGNDDLSRIEKTFRSGTERNTLENRLSFLFNNLALLPFLYLQLIFMRLDFGDGYIATAQKKQLQQTLRAD